MKDNRDVSDKYQRLATLRMTDDADDAVWEQIVRGIEAEPDFAAAGDQPSGPGMAATGEPTHRRDRTGALRRRAGRGKRQVRWDRIAGAGAMAAGLAAAFVVLIGVHGHAGSVIGAAQPVAGSGATNAGSPVFRTNMEPFFPAASDWWKVLALLAVWAGLSVLFLRLRAVKWLKVAAVLASLLVLASVYFNVQLYQDYKQSAVYGMMGVVGHLDSAVGLLDKQDPTDAALEVATAGGALLTLASNTNAQVLGGGANLTHTLGEYLEVTVAPTLVSGGAKENQAAQFVRYADQVFSAEKKYGNYRLSDLPSQLQQILKHEPKL